MQSCKELDRIKVISLLFRKFYSRFLNRNEEDTHQFHIKKQNKLFII